MRIDELDEFQGVTPSLITDWLSANGWVQTKPGWWDREEDGFVFDSANYQEWIWLHALAAVYGRTIQGMLSEINPRMRKGTPSLAAWEAHGGKDGWWIAVDHDNHTEGSSWENYQERPIVTHLRQWVRSDNAIWWTYGMPGIGWNGPVARPDWKASFWPCDAKGNKVRWPTDAHGNML